MPRPHYLHPRALQATRQDKIYFRNRRLQILSSSGVQEEVELVGTPVHFTSSTDGSQAITIPPDIEVIFVAVTGYHSTSGELSATGLLDEINWDNGGTFDFEEVGKSAFEFGVAESDWCTSVYMMQTTDVNYPGQGAQTLYWASPVYDEGFNFYVFFANKVDTTDPINDVIDTAPGDSDPWTTALSGVGPKDLAMVVTYDYQATTDVDPGGSGQFALLESAVFNDNAISVGYKYGDPTLETTGSFTAGVAFAINASPI